jgi:ligand-binding sensor protein
MDITGKLVVAVVTRHETRIWATDAAKGEAPNVVETLPVGHKHDREAQHHGGHDSSKSDKPYYESISAALAGAGEILLIGHGHGKGNSMVQLVQHLERHHSDVARKIVGAIDENIAAMSDGELLAAARKWYDHHAHGLAGF